VATVDAYYEKRTAWDDYTHGNLNISIFVFRDINRNGTYDLGDRAMSGVAVEATGLGRTKAAWTNASGFANFRMSATDAGMEIVFAGTYEFRTIVPQAWSITTGNEIQQVEFELRPGAPGDLIAIPPPVPVGLMPDLTISGHVDADLVQVTSPTAAEFEVRGREGWYSFPSSSGEWTLAFPATGDAPATERRIEVNGAPIVVSNVQRQAEFAASSTTHTELVTFDDLLSEGIMKIPSGYAGLNWGNFVMTHQKFYDSEGYRNTTMSGEFLAYNGSGHPVWIGRERPFNFVGGYFGASTLGAEGETLSIKAWRGEELAYEQAITLSALGPIYFAADFRAITRIDFETAHYWQFACDDLTFELFD